MSKTLMTLIIVFFALTVLSVPIAYSIGFAGLAALLVEGNTPLMMVPQRLFSAVDSFTLLAIPFFIIAGDIMIKGGISKRLIQLAKTIVGSMKGGMAYVTFLASAFFGALSGSSNATTVAIGGMMYPEMIKDGYPASYSAAIGATAGSLGVLIPPSIAFVIVGSTNNVSIASLFKMGVIVGIFAMVGYCVIVKLTMRRMCPNVSAGERSTFKDFLAALKSAFWALLSPLIILGGIYSGQFTATEAAVISIVYSAIVSIFIYKEMTWKELVKTLIGSAKTTGRVLIISATSGLLSWVVTANGLVAVLQNWFGNLSIGILGFLLIINIIYLILGMIMDPIPVFILTTPILLPIAAAYGVSPLHFCTLIVFNVVFGVITPPFGADVFAATTYTNEPISRIFADCRYFMIGGVVMTLIVTYLPLFFYYY